MSLEFWIAWRLLTNRLRQALLGTLGVAVGVSSLIVMRSMIVGFLYEFVNKMIDTFAHVMVLGEEWSESINQSLNQTSVVTGSTEPIRLAFSLFSTPAVFTTSRPPLPKQKKGIDNWEQVARQIELLPNVVATTAVVGLEGIAVFGGRTQIIWLEGIDPYRYSRTVRFQDRITSGDLRSLQSNPQSIILGVKIAEELGVQLGDRVTVVGANKRTTTLKVVGFYQSRVSFFDFFYSFVPLRTVQRLKGTERMDAIYVRLTNLRYAEDMTQTISRLTGLDAKSWHSISRSALAIFTMISMITSFVVGIILLVSGFGIAIVLLMLVSEKKGNIGLLKACGMTPHRISLSFLIVGLFIATAGILVGELVGWLGVEILDQTPTGLKGFGTFVESETFPMFRRWDIYVIGAVTALIITVIFSWFPARKASQLDPVSILRGE